MKRIVISVVIAMNSMLFAGGDSMEPVVQSVPVIEKPNEWYVGIGVAAVSTRASHVSVDLFNTRSEQDRLGNVTLLAGYNLNEYIAIEGRYTNSFTHDENIEMDAWSLFIKPQYPVSEDFSVYGLLGYGGVKLDGERATGIVDVDDTTIQWGLGLNYMIVENVSIFADYTWLAYGMDGVYVGENEVDVDVFTVGINYFF